jgi:hypothetical protein
MTHITSGLNVARASAVAFVTCFLSGPTIAQTPTPEEFLARSRAVEGVIWGMPAVNAELMLQEMLTKTRERSIK